MEKDSEKLSWNDNSSFFHCLFKFGKEKERVQRKQKCFYDTFNIGHLYNWVVYSFN